MTLACRACVSPPSWTNGLPPNGSTVSLYRLEYVVCTSMTVALGAPRTCWPLEWLTGTLRAAQEHAADCADCETREGYLDRIDRVIRFTGSLSTEQQARLLEIAEKCPVHRTLTSE